MEAPTATDRGPNHLIGEKSPYLRQHANNPVDWYPWGNEAFQRARELDRPIFLSIGYSSCHWCHVMEKESFEDEEVAKLLNDSFVSIKVDREERPDVDSTYMTAAQLLSGGGGWPLTVILTPDLRPFFAATYLPKDSKMSMTGLTVLLPTIAEFWQTRREELEESSARVLEAMREAGGSTAGGSMGEENLMATFQNLMEAFDERYGGFGRAPKFPTPHRLTFLLRYWNRTSDPKALWMADRTLEAMRNGGMYDQLGGGFHRYSTDQAWLVPHFEKMLYDQALLAIAYIEGWQATGKEDHASTAREVLDYVLDRLTSPEGGFCSAEDADSEGEEGRFYFWTEGQAAAVLDPPALSAAHRLFGLSQEGNVREGLWGELGGRNVLRLASPEGRSDPLYLAIRSKLLSAREKRSRPGLDDKVLADWNGLMIAAMARGAAAFDEERYLQAARRAAELVLDRMRSSDGVLLHMYRDGAAPVPGFLDDHAFMAWGLLELFQADQDLRWLEEAIIITEQMIARFWDRKEGGFFQAEASDERMPRLKDVYDGALPSGNSIAILDLLTLYRITEEPDLLEKADAAVSALSGAVFGSPENHAQLMNAIDFRVGPSYSIVISGHGGSPDTTLFFKALAPRFVPNKVVLLNEPGPPGERLGRISPLAQGQGMHEGRAVAHLCTEQACLQETADPETFASLLRPA
ncbi:MAG: thioredoxin domain-containing protein [Methanomassiliicoccus sp.]|nr:thioredoxin domain-containing protein [Methanomassiliicoccus sp.]